MIQEVNLNIYLELMGIDTRLWNHNNCFSFQRRFQKEKQNGKDVYVLKLGNIEDGNLIQRVIEIVEEENHMSIHYKSQEEKIQDGEIKYFQKDVIGEFTFEENQVVLLLGQVSQEKEVKTEIRSVDSVLDISNEEIEVKVYDNRIFGSKKRPSKLKIK